MGGRERGSELFYIVTSPLYAATVFRYDIATRKSAPFDAGTPAFDPTAYETRQVFYTSKDGTRVPMFITARKGLALDGSHPAWLYGYGGFAISVLPAYRVSLPAWLEMGGIYSQPALRGGAEYGEEWHRAGMLEKQNVFDDFIAAAEYLVAAKYTTPAKLVMEGGSNGGLLVGAAMTQRPDLFAVAIPVVGVLDMLRFDRFTGGQAWAVEYGSSAKADQFDYLIRYSPLHNLKTGNQLSGDARRHRRPRRPRGAEPFVQVRRGAAGSAGLRKAGSHPRRNAGEPRLPADGPADRRARRHPGLRGRPAPPHPAE